MTTRRFRLPALGAAAAEFSAVQNRALSGPIGCLLILAGISFLLSFLFFFSSGHRLLLLGFAALVIGAILVRFGIGIIYSWIAALGLGAALAGTMIILGIEATWVYLIGTSLFFLIALMIVGTVSKVSPEFIGRQSFSSLFGCRIGFFRPFHKTYSTQARNILYPLLKGYGSVYFVTDESFDEAKFTGLWSKDYEKLPGLVGGYRYTDDTWQSQIKKAIKKIDVAVVDISMPSPNVIWEIKQCYDWLPSHRIIFVLSAHVLSTNLTDFEDQELQKALWSHIEPILQGLNEMGANPTIKPLCLAYSSEVEGQVWLGRALYQAMYNIVALEAVEIQTPH